MTQTTDPAARRWGWVVLGLIAIGVGAVQLDWAPRIACAIETGQAEAAGARLAVATDLSQAFRSVAKAIRPSVVSISSVRRVEAGGPANRSNGQIPPELRQFFDDNDLGRFFEFQPPQRYEQRGLGSGVIVSADGYVLTNNHVVGDADEVEVTLSDGRRFRAELVGGDKSTDIAVLRIDADDLKPADMGDSDALEVGEWVLAMGSPFGLDQTLTAGIISAKGRANVGISDYEDFVQTDAAINPGNSGGPLVNLRGQVIGINTAIASRSGGYMGVGFAIPSNMARKIKDDIIRNGKVVRGYLGAMIQDLNEGLAQSFGYDSPTGVLIGDLAPGGPGEEAGLRPGDIVSRYNGRVLKDANDLRNQVAATEPGTKSTLQVYREGKSMELPVNIGTLNGEVAAGPVAQQRQSALGLEVESLTPELAARLRMSNVERGAVVTQVESGSVAARSGMRPGDVVVAVGVPGAGDREVANARDYYDAVAKVQVETGVRLQVVREGLRLYVFLKAPN